MLKWSKQFVIGIDAVDDQHHTWIDLMGRFDQLKGLQFSVQAVEAALADVIAFAKMHFADEEKLFNSAGFPFAAYHQGLHQKFFQLAEEWKAAKIDNEADCAKLGLKINKWFLHHVCVEDRRFGKFILEKMARNR